MDKNTITSKVEMHIADEPYIEMMKYAHEFSPNECSGVGFVERSDYDDGSVEFKVTKVFLPNHTGSGGRTDLPEEELNKLNTELVVAGEDTSLLKFHWHSHVDMSVFHSATDDENYDDMQTGDYAVSLVVNKQYEMLGSVHLYSPLRINVLNIDIEPPNIDVKEYTLPTALAKKIKDNVARVHAYQTAKTPVWQETWTDWDKKHGYSKNTPTGYDHMDTGAHGYGLEHDSALYSLLKAGEQQGLIVLIWDDTNTYIEGYYNPKTRKSYELQSYDDYVDLSRKGGLCNGY